MMKNYRYYLPGVMLIALAILVLALPRFVSVIIAAFVIFTGVTALYLGKVLKDFQNEIDKDVFVEYQSIQSPSAWYTLRRFKRNC